MIERVKALGSDDKSTLQLWRLQNNRPHSTPQALEGLGNGRLMPPCQLSPCLLNFRAIFRSTFNGEGFV